MQKWSTLSETLQSASPGKNRPKEDTMWRDELRLFQVQIPSHRLWQMQGGLKNLQDRPCDDSKLRALDWTKASTHPTSR
jgi:hypothetical protein